MFNKIVKKIKRNPIIKLVYYSYIQKSGVTCIDFNGKKIKSIFIFGKEIIQKYKCDNAFINNNTLVYFKINRDANYSINCINKWIEIVSTAGLQYVFVCDNDALKFDVLKNCKLNDYFIGFLKSDRKGLRKVVKNFYTGNWEYATYAHLTPFYHANSIGKKEYWCIDADDTMFLLDNDRCAQILSKVENMSLDKGISAFSLDMWRSKTGGKHWSLGVLFINDNINYCDLFNCLSNNNWINQLNCFDDSYNLDWFFTYLKDIKNYNIQTFYIENAVFIHWSDDMIRNNSSSWVNIWKENKVIYPILKYVYGNEFYGAIDIADCIKFDIGLQGNEYTDYIITNSDYNLLSDTRRKLLGID